ncbi:MAG: hypothetical protein P8L37_04970 [Phycisphaerales bacterium]|nr:hypothetical protein [Phycisphaerales bacterium]
MIDTSQYTDRFRELERAWQWVILAVAFLLAFVVWSSVIAPIGDDWAAQSDRIEANLARTSGKVTLDASTKSAAMIYGPVELPDMKESGSLSLTEVVHAILATHGITNDTFYQSQSANIKVSALPGIARAGEKLERIKGELDFESKPDTAISIVADLERSSAVEALSNLKIDKLGNGTVRTRLTLEAWVRTK